MMKVLHVVSVLCTFLALSVSASATGNIEQLCSFDPDVRKYRVTNTGSSTTTFTISAAMGGGAVSKTRTIEPGKSFQFTYNSEFAGNGVALYSEGNILSTTRNTAMICSPELPLSVVNVCHNDLNRRRWAVENPNDKTIYVTYDDIDEDGIYLGQKIRTILKAGSGLSHFGADAGTGNYTYISTYSNDITLHYGEDWSVMAYGRLDQENNVCQPTHPISVVNTCHIDPEKRRWSIENLNNHEVHVRYHLIDENGDTTGWKYRILPSKGKGQAEDKGPFRTGDFIFVTTLTDRLEVFYGQEFGSSAIANLEVDPGVCSELLCPQPAQGCEAAEVIYFSQGFMADGEPVDLSRSNPDDALAVEGNNARNSFVSLGFGGEIILKLNGAFVNGPGNDIRIYETSYGSPACQNYPEHAKVYGSKCGSLWTELGNTCLDGTLDLGELDWIGYLKIVDTSNPEHFDNNADGYDVDGVMSLQCEQPALLETSTISAFPNPHVNSFGIGQLEEPDGTLVAVSIYDQLKLVQHNISTVFDSEVSVTTSHLKPGLYIVKVDIPSSGKTYPGRTIQKL